MSIREAEEGAVLYFVMNHKQDNEKMLSMCKLKTLEYRVFRKLREKLRNFVEACQTG
jgi:D-Tyr-tRNAtyr deacylase